MKYMKLSQAVEKFVKMIERYGDIDVVQQSSNGGIEPINFYLMQVPDLESDDGSFKVVACIRGDGDFNPELGNEDEVAIEKVPKELQKV